MFLSVPAYLPSCSPMRLQAEMSHDVQHYDRRVYLRVSEAQRCRVSSTLVVPIFTPEQPDRAVAVFELVRNDTSSFQPVIHSLSKLLEVRRV